MNKRQIVNAVKTDGIDEVAFASIKEASKLAELCKSASSEGLVQDAFTSFYSSTAKLLEDAPAAQKGVIDAMMKLPEFDSLRHATQSDEIASGIGAVRFAPGLIQQFNEAEAKLEKAKKKAREKGEAEPQALEDALSESEKAGLRQGLRKALEGAQEDADAWAEAKGLWGVDSGELQNLPAEQRFALAEQLLKSASLQKIADMVGRFKNVVNSASATVPVHGYDEIVNIGIGNDIQRVLPTEYVKLAETPDLFFSDFVEGKLLVYDVQGVENLGKGPIIACLDISGSMAGPREEWAKGVVLALQALAEKQGRAFGVIAFESKIEFSSFWPKGKKATLQEKVQIASIQSNGGTSFYAPLTKAFEFRTAEPELRPADIIMITDGECELSPEQIKEIQSLKHKTDTRIFSIAINFGHYGGTQGYGLESFSDEISVVNSDGDIESVRKVVSKAASTQSTKKKV